MYYCDEPEITCANVIEYIQKLSQQLEDSQSKCVEQAKVIEAQKDMIRELQYDLYNATHDPNPHDG